MQGLYRQNALFHRCVECGDHAQQRCPRCGRRLCPEHMPADTLCCAACEEEWEVRRLQLATLGPLTGAGGSPWVLLHMATCVLFVVGLSMLLLAMLTLPPWVNSRPVEVGLVADVVLLTLLLQPTTVGLFVKHGEARARRRFLAERPETST